jgi:hypothetical protein
MILQTASEGINFSRELEAESDIFYQEIARCFPGDAETFLSFSEENRKNVTNIERTYRGVITDAIEGGYAFSLDPALYYIGTEVPKDISRAEMLGRAIEIENTIIRFYQDAASQSKSLMADIPRVFLIIARKREGRIEKLRTLL